MRYDSLVYGLSHGILKSRHAAEDVRQEVFLLVRERLDQLQDGTRFAPWVATITRNACLSLLRRSKPERSLELLGEDDHPVVTIEGPFEKQEQRTLLRKWVDELPEEQRTAIELHYFQEQRVAMIARFLGAPESTVKWRIHQGRVALREAATVQGYAHPGR